MKSQLNEMVERKYPCLLINRTDKLIVLFTKKSTGTVVVGNNYHTLGYTLDCWRDENFKLFEGEVTLSN
jgi:hypothetical protein